MTKTLQSSHEQRQMETIVLFVSDFNLQLSTVNIVRCQNTEYLSTVSRIPHHSFSADKQLEHTSARQAGSTDYRGRSLEALVRI